MDKKDNAEHGGMCLMCMKLDCYNKGHIVWIFLNNKNDSWQVVMAVIMLQKSY